MMDELYSWRYPNKANKNSESFGVGNWLGYLSALESWASTVPLLFKPTLHLIFFVIVAMVTTAFCSPSSHDHDDHKYHCHLFAVFPSSTAIFLVYFNAPISSVSYFFPFKSIPVPSLVIAVFSHLFASSLAKQFSYFVFFVQSIFP